MQYTSPTKIIKKGTKAFSECDEMVILKNNDFLGLYLGGALGKAVQESGIIQQIREELWEMNDRETVSIIDDYRKNGLGDDAIDFSEFIKDYEL